MEVVLGFECRPIQAWWLAAEGQCLNLVAFAYFTNITNLVSDMWIFAMPLPIIMKLQTNTNKRLTLCFLFSVGLGVCSISAARLRFVFANASTDITCEFFFCRASRIAWNLDMTLTHFLAHRGCSTHGNPVRLGTLRCHTMRKPAHDLRHAQPEHPHVEDTPQHRIYGRIAFD